MGAIYGSLAAKALPSLRAASDVWIALIATSSCVAMCQAGSEMMAASPGQKRLANRVIVVSNTYELGADRQTFQGGTYGSFA